MATKRDRNIDQPTEKRQRESSHPRSRQMEEGKIPPAKPSVTPPPSKTSEGRNDE